MIQNSLESNLQKHPFNSYMPMLSWGKVVMRHPEDGTFDVAIQNGSTFNHVQAISPYLGSKVGLFYLPTHDLTNPIQTKDGVWDIPIQSTKNDLYCVVGFLEGSSRQSKILGFFNPAQTEMSFSTLGIKVDRHESGVYHITLPNGHDETHYPDGSYIVAGDTTSHDMTLENSNWSPPTQGIKMPFVFHHSSGTVIQIDATGKVTVTSVNGVVFNNLTVGSGGHAVALADILTTWLNGHTHTSAASGSPTSAPITPVSGISSASLTTN